MTDNRSFTNSQTEEPRFIGYSVGVTRILENFGLKFLEVSVSRVARQIKPDQLNCQRRCASYENGDKPCFGKICRLYTQRQSRLPIGEG